MLLALAACAPPGEPALLLTGWEYDWEQLSHRVSYVRVGIGDDSSLALGLVGGDWSTGATFTDTPHYRVRYQQVTADGVQVWRGTADLLVGPDGTASTDLVLPGVEPRAGDTLVAVIQGFSLDTAVDQPDGYPEDYDPAYGYTSNGFGFSLGDPTLDGDTATIPVDATVRWGPQDREDMNRAIPYAVTAVTVDVALIATPGDVEPVPLDASAAYPRQSPYTDQPPMELPVDVDAGPRESFLAWRSFDLQADLTGPDAGEGDYLRAFGAELVPSDAGAHAWNGSAVATVSTSSAIEFTELAAGFTGELVRIGAPDVVADHWLVSGSHPTGPAVTGPTLPQP